MSTCPKYLLPIDIRGIRCREYFKERSEFEYHIKCFEKGNDYLTVTRNWRDDNVELLSIATNLQLTIENCMKKQQ